MLGKDFEIRGLEFLAAKKEMESVNAAIETISSLRHG
jgi:hypothetical protein